MKILDNNGLLYLWQKIKAYVDGKSFNIDKAYPVGAIYMSVNATNPGSLLGGTWVAWGTGRVPVGVDTTQAEFNTPQKTGGSKYLDSHRHDNGTLTTSEKALSGTIDIRTLTGGSQGFPVHSSGILSYDVQGGISLNSNVEIKTAARNADRIAIDAKHDHPVTGNTGYSGSGNSGNLPPYITCYMWRRTA
jgi:hypothetical protein